MSNFNTMSHTKRRTLHINGDVGGESKALQVRYSITYRYGADEDIAEDTTRRFRFLCNALANFDSWQDSDKWNSVDVIPNYELMFHEQARVLIYGDVFVKIGDKLFTFTINTFTEDTAVRGMFNFIHMCVASSDTLDMIDNELKREDLGQWFPDKPAAQAQTQVTPAANGDTEAIIWDGKRWEQYQEQYAGKKLKIRIGKTARVFKAKKDGSGTYEVITFFPLRDNGAISDYDIWRCQVFVNDSDNNYDYKQLKANGFVEQFLPTAGSELTQPATLVMKINPDKNNADKFYWNFTGLVFDNPLQTNDSST